MFLRRCSRAELDWARIMLPQHETIAARTLKPTIRTVCLALMRYLRSICIVGFCIWKEGICSLALQHDSVLTVDIASLAACRASQLLRRTVSFSMRSRL